MCICEKLMTEHNLTFSSTKRNGRGTPFSNNLYCPELDSSNYCSYNGMTISQKMDMWISMNRYSIQNVGAITIFSPTTCWAFTTVSKHIFYSGDRSRLTADPMSFDVDWVPQSEGDIHTQERATVMKDLYPDVCDEVAIDMPDPRGKEVDINVFVDADHVGNVVTRRSHTSAILMCNMMPVQWYSKKQNTFETTTFGSDLLL